MNYGLNYDLLVITGPTASGKTLLAATIADMTWGEIISADSRQVYRGMNIGTGKDYDDYLVRGRKIPVHLIDIVDPGHKYNLFEYYRDFFKVYRSLKERKVFPVVCGGSGMYVDSIVSGYAITEVPPDIELRKELEEKSMEELIKILSSYRNPHNRTDFENKKRIIRAIEVVRFGSNCRKGAADATRIKSLVVGVAYDRDVRRRRITERLRQRLEEGMIGEVEQLIAGGVSTETLEYYGLEYKYITQFVTGKLAYEAMVRQLEIAIHQFAKRQMTWFRGMERRGVRIHWISGELSLNEKADTILEILKGKAESPKSP